MEQLQISEQQKTEILKNRVLEKIEKLEKSGKISEAVDFALELHADQKPRPDGLYVNHILRAIERLLDLGITDSDILIASVLHDSVEDQYQKIADMFTGSEELSVKEKAVEFLKQKYGQRVAEIITSVTNTEQSDDISQEEADKEYVSHIVQVIENPSVFYVKISDFMDNGPRVPNISDAKRRIKLAKKYLPLFRIFIDRIQKDDIVLPQDKKDEIISWLSDAESLANKVIK